MEESSSALQPRFTPSSLLFPSEMRRNFKSSLPRETKDKIRLECSRMIQKERDNLLWHVRNKKEREGIVQAAIKGLVEEVVLSSQSPGSSQSQANEYDDYVEYMQALEQSLFEDWLKAEAHSLHLAEEEDIQRIAENFVGEASYREEGVRCPVCSSAFLEEDHGQIHCPLDNYTLAINMTLSNLREELARTLEVHTNQCGGGGQCGIFSIRQHATTSYLRFHCPQCNMDHVVTGNS